MNFYDERNYTVRPCCLLRYYRAVCDYDMGTFIVTSFSVGKLINFFFFFSLRYLLRTKKTVCSLPLACHDVYTRFDYSIVVIIYILYILASLDDIICYCIIVRKSAQDITLN